MCSVAVLFHAEQSEVLGQATQTRPKFQSGVEVVQLDVSVLDRNNQPVRGLTASDFEVLEDGRLQRIVNFSSVELPPPAPSATAWPSDVTPDVHSNTIGADRRLIVLLLDDALVERLRDLATMTRTAVDIINRLGGGDLAAVVFTRDQRNGQEFTADRARLLQAVQHSTPAIREPTGRELFERYSLQTLRSVTESLAAIPHRRKAVFFISPGIPIDFEALATPMKYGDIGDPQGVASVHVNEMRATFRQAQLANVNIYCIDIHGLDASPGGSDTFKLEREFLQTVSENTGGFAIVNTNEFAPGVTQVFRENSAYYLVSYERQDTRADSGYRRIDVRVNRPDVRVRARKGYLAVPARPSAGSPVAPGASPSGAFAAAVAGITLLEDALAGFIPKADLPMSVNATAFAGGRHGTAALVVTIGVPTASVQSGTEGTDNVEVLIGAYDTSWKAVATRRLRATLVGTRDNDRLEGGRDAVPLLGQAAPGTSRLASQPGPGLSPGAPATLAGAIVSQIDLRPGRYQLRVAATSTRLQRTGSVFCDVLVPDFWKMAVSLSGLVISVRSGSTLPATDADTALAGDTKALPVVPTVRREFGRDEDVSAFVRVYQGGSGRLDPVDLTVRIIDARNADLIRTNDTLAPERFGSTRSADLRTEIPMARLAPGTYLLRIEAARGKRTPTAQAVAFAVR